MRQLGVFRHFWSDWPLAPPAPEHGCVWAQRCHSQCPSCCPWSLTVPRVSPQLLPGMGAYLNPSTRVPSMARAGWGWCCGCLVASKSDS